MIWLTRIAATALVLGSSQIASAQAPPVRKVHAYDGARRSSAQVATVFGKMLTRPLALTFICEVDGKSYRAALAASICPSVVYLLPGRHQLQISHGTGVLGGHGTVSMHAEVGRVYEIEVGPVAAMRAEYRVRPLPRGFVLTYKDVSPGPFLSGTRQNSPIDPAGD
jgi:hypothetical protein